MVSQFTVNSNSVKTEDTITGLGVCSGTIKRGCPEAASAVMTKSFKS